MLLYSKRNPCVFNRASVCVYKVRSNVELLALCQNQTGPTHKNVNDETQMDANEIDKCFFGALYQIDKQK